MNVNLQKYFSASALAMEGLTIEQQIEKLHGQERVQAEINGVDRLLTDTEGAALIPAGSPVTQAIRIMMSALASAIAIVGIKVVKPSATAIASATKDVTAIVRDLLSGAYDKPAPGPTPIATNVHGVWYPKPIPPDEVMRNEARFDVGDPVYGSAGYWLVGTPQSVPQHAPDETGAPTLDHLIHNADPVPQKP